MKRFITLAALALVAMSTSATTCKNGGSNWPTCTPPTPVPTPSTLNVSPSSSSSSISGAVSSSSAQAGATSSLSGTLTAAGGAGGAGGSLSFDEFGRQNLYVLPAPVQAAPLPPGLCPQGDSISVGILWNLFSFSQSSTRTEMQCLEMVLSSIKAAQPVIQPAMSPLSAAEKALLERLDRESRERAESARSAPASTSPIPGAAASAATKAKKVAAKKPAATKKPDPLPDCGADGVLQCKPKKST
jgi:hypothetical protein